MGEIGTERQSPPGEAGFSLVEVLVALVVASMLALAVGGLIGFAIDLEDRSERSDKTIAAILDLEALRSAILEAAGPSKGVAIDEARRSGFKLIAERDRQNIPMMIEILAAADARPAAINLTFGMADDATASTVDLSQFDTAMIDYLVSSAEILSWTGGDSVGDVALAARLLVTQGTRQWAVPLWVVSRD